MLKTQTSRQSSVQSVTRALDIFEALGVARDGLGVTELARELGLKAPTTHNLLRTLVMRGYVAKDGSTQKYRLAAACGALGRAFQRGLRLPVAARPHLEALSAKLNESAVLGVLEHGEMAFVARVEAQRMLTVSFEHVWVRDGYASVCGRVLLAHMPPHDLKAYLSAHPIAQSRAEDIRSKKSLTAALEEVRRQGVCAYWRDKQTVFAVAAPVFDADGRAAAAVGLALPGIRFRKEDRPEIVRAVSDAARSMSEELGWREEAATEA